MQAYSIRRRAFCSLSLHILEAHVLTDQASAYEAPCGFTQWESHLAVLSFSLPPPLSKSRARDRGGGALRGNDHTCTSSTCQIYFLDGSRREKKQS